MSNYLSYLETWHQSKSRIFSAEALATSVSDISVGSEKSRNLDIESGKIAARATMWESGRFEIEVSEKGSGATVLRRAFLIESDSELDDKLNWWLSEIVIY